MKYFRYADIIIQSLIFILAILALTGSSDTPFLAVQFLMGVYQMVSSLISLLVQRHRLKLIHFAVSALYLLSFLLIPYTGWSKEVQYVYLVAPSWLLAVYYYVVSLKLNWRRNKRSKFLPHLSF